MFPAGREHVSGPNWCACRGPAHRDDPAGAVAAARGDDPPALDLAGGFPGRYLAGMLAAERLRRTRRQGGDRPALAPRWCNWITTGLGVLIAPRGRSGPLDGRPSGSRLLGVDDLFRRHNQAAAFADLAARAGEWGFAEHEAGALNALDPHGHRHRQEPHRPRPGRSPSVMWLPARGCLTGIAGRAAVRPDELLRRIGVWNAPRHAAPGPGPRSADGCRAGGPLPAGRPAVVP